MKLYSVQIHFQVHTGTINCAYCALDLILQLEFSNNRISRELELFSRVVLEEDFIYPQQFSEDMAYELQFLWHDFLLKLHDFLNITQSLFIRYSLNLSI